MSKGFKILVIDDEKLIRWSFEKNLSAKGYKIHTAETGEEGLNLFEKHLPDLVFVDNHLPDTRGLELIVQMKTIHENSFIVFMTAYETVDVAVDAMKKGAFEYIRKPFSFEEIYELVERLNHKLNHKEDLIALQNQQKEDITFEHIIHRSSMMKRIIQDSKKISKTEATTILLLGESGTGKDVFARAIHNESNRKSKPFVTINCSSLPETLLESELFGHEKGAFTDARELKKGLFEIAQGGTVYLDEIGEINKATQLKLLGVLENRVIMRLGSTREIPVDVRIIAATNKNIQASIENKTFREDLYYRLQVFQINIPRLCDRKEDVPLLLDYFISFFNKMFQKNITSIAPDARKLLERCNWRGNVRELRNVIERAVILQSGSILKVSSLPIEIDHNLATNNHTNGYHVEFPEEGISLEILEKQVIAQALEIAEFNQTRAAQLLDISRDTLRYKMKKHKL